MKLDFTKLSIKRQLLITFVFFVILASINYLIITYVIDKTDNTRVKAEVSEELLTHVHSLTAAIEAATLNDQTASKKVYNHAVEVQKQVDLFRNGGVLPDSDIEIDPVKSPKLKRLVILWDSLYAALDIYRFQPHQLDTITQEVQEIPTYDSLNSTITKVVDVVIKIDNPAVVKAKSYLDANTTDLNKRAKSFSNAMFEEAADSKDFRENITLLMFFLNILFISLILYGIRIIFLTPIDALKHTTQKLSEGDFDVTTEFKWQNEVSEVSNNLNKLAANLKNATEFVKEVEKGDLNATFKGIDLENLNKNSLEGALIDMRDQMKKVDEEEEIRNWSTSGLAKFVDILRSSDDNVKSLCDKIISNLVEYTHSNLGGLYLINDEDQSERLLDLISMYAYGTKKFETKSYRLGEGLVGQTFLERKTTYLLEIPEDYIEITSGLGSTEPTAILIVPLQVNEEIFGVIELASLNEYKPYQIEFVETLGESIASTIAGVKNNQKTKKLLEESQELTEQMQAQEEEMRQNMEELSATQEEMARKEIEITAQLKAINNTLGTVEYDINGVVINSNIIFEDALGYTQDELYETPISTFYHGDLSFWKSFESGKDYQEVVKFTRKNGETIALKSSFTPIKNEEGEYYKVIQIVSQIGEGATSEGSAWGEAEAVEAALKQNLAALEITQQELNKQLETSRIISDLYTHHLFVIEVNIDKTIKSASQALLNFLGKSNSELVGQSVGDILGNEIIKSIDEKSTSCEVEVVDREGNIVKENLKIVYGNEGASNNESILIIWI